MFWNNFYALCEANSQKPLQVVKALGIATGSITKWKNGTMPSMKNLEKIAAYFNVSVEYLFSDHTAENKNPAAEVSEEDLKVALFGGDREVSEEMWNEVLDYAKYLKQKYDKT